MNLSDVEILNELDNGRLVIDPRPSLKRVSAASVDLGIAAKAILLRPSEGVTVNPAEIGDINEHLARNGEIVNLSEGSGFDMPPSTFVIATTLEKIAIPSHLMARVEGKSSFARYGLAIHQTAPTIQPGFNGTLTLEMYNSGPFNIKLNTGTPICQLIIERLGLPAMRAGVGRFVGQTYVSDSH